MAYIEDGNSRGAVTWIFGEWLLTSKVYERLTCDWTCDLTCDGSASGHLTCAESLCARGAGCGARAGFRVRWNEWRFPGCRQIARRHRLRGGSNGLRRAHSLP